MYTGSNLISPLLLFQFIDDDSEDGAMTIADDDHVGIGTSGCI